MSTDPAFDPLDPTHDSCATGRLLDDLALFGRGVPGDEPDSRPAAAPAELGAAVADIFDALIAPLSDTCLEPLTADLLWAAVNLFHRAAERVQRRLDDNEMAQQAEQRRQDGSEVASVALERLLAQGAVQLAQREGLEFLRDEAVHHFERHTGAPWLPRAGSRANRQTLTAAMIDSRDFLAAQRRAEAQTLIPPGPKIAITGGGDYLDHARVWYALDKALAKHPDMVLMHGGTPTGVERIAACWAQARSVTHIAFKPDWNRDRKAAPFRRNDALLAALPIGLLAFPGSGIHANLVDKARKLGIPVWRFEGGDA
ncbi:hypothetical protein AS593_06560 [Caulobacter vibrioides]|nr:hypothetical protein AS593_06560 [Caulobacter vibrioides]